MSKGKKRDQNKDDVIIEAEIVEETPQAAKPKPQPTTEASVKTTDIPATKNTAARIAWGIAFLLLAFIGGIFAEPLAEQGLKRLGLMKEDPPQAEAVAQPAIDLTPINSAQQQQKERIASLEAAFTTQSESLKSLQNENAALKRDITTLATGLPAGEQAEISSQLLIDMGKRLELAEAALIDVKTKRVENATENSTVARLDGELKLARAETAQLLERLSLFEKSFEVSQSQKLADSAEGRAALTLHRLYLSATAGADFSADIAALKPDLAKVPLPDLQNVSQSLGTLEANQSGIATQSDIVRGFNALIPELLKANVAETNTGWLANFFTVRDKRTRQAIASSIQRQWHAVSGCSGAG